MTRYSSVHAIRLLSFRVHDFAISKPPLKPDIRESTSIPSRPSPQSAILEVISLDKLMSNEAATVSKLLAACTDTGFFYLDCTDWKDGLSANQIKRLFQTSKALYDLAREEKNVWVADHNHAEDMIVGYKDAGMGSGPVEGKKDGFEGFMIFEHPLGCVSDPTTMAAPGPLQAEGSLLQANVSVLRDIGLLILTSLSQSLDLTGESSFTSTHRKGEASTTALGLLKYLPYGTAEDIGVGHIAHTDAGSLSFVFTDVPGLQVAMPGTDEWAYITPREGHAIVNVGDSLQFLSRGRLRSSLHRVVPHPDALNRTKYTIVYLMRPETDAAFVDGDGKEWKSKNWYLQKFEVFGKDGVDESHSSVLTGRKDYDGRWNPLIAAATV
ncbi:hypothetical protein McanCB49686_000261 [Microsporum canis]